MTKTTNELATAVLRTLGVIDATETPDDADVEYVTGVYTDKFEELNDRELTYWSPSEVPEPVFITVRDLIANEVSGDYGQPLATEDKAGRERILLMQLRRHMHERPSGLPVRAVYF